MREPAPPQWPRPVPLLYLPSDYGDVREHILRYGRLDVAEELFTSNSDDGWSAFHARHRSEDFNRNWHELNQRDQARREATARRARQRLSTVASREQERWEAEQLKRQRAKQAVADREWAAAAAERRRVIDELARIEAEAKSRALAQARANLEASKQPSVRLLALLLRSPQDLQDYHKIDIATELEALFAARGAGPLKVAAGREAEVSGLSAKQLALAKYQWYRDNLKTLGRFYPPAIL